MILETYRTWCITNGVSPPFSDVWSSLRNFKYWFYKRLRLSLWILLGFFFRFEFLNNFIGVSSMVSLIFDVYCDENWLFPCWRWYQKLVKQYREPLSLDKLFEKMKRQIFMMLGIREFVKNHHSCPCRHNISI